MIPITRGLALHLLAAALLAAGEARAAACIDPESLHRPAIGLALGGGGARGAAHIGVLKRLEELRIPVDHVAGTSMGAIVGGFLASGMTAGEIEKVVMDARWENLFSDHTRRQDRPLRRKSDDDLGLFGPRLGIGAESSLLPGGAIAGQKVALLLENTLAPRTREHFFADMPIPFRAIATNLATGEAVQLTEGNLGRAIRASMSVPGALDPVEMNHPVSGQPVLLVDGGMARNLPVDIARDMGADIVIAVNVEYPLLGVEQLKNVLEIVNQLTTLMVAGNTREQLARMQDRDILLTPALDADFPSTAFERVEEAIELGYQAAQAAADLTALSLGENEYREWRARVEACVSPAGHLDFVTLENRSRFSDAVIWKQLATRAGQALDAELVQQDMARIHALGFIRSARYRVVDDGGRTGLVIDIEPDPRGADFIETGLEITGNSRGTGIDLKTAYLKTDIDERGTEFRALAQLGDQQGVLAELYRPMDDTLRWVLRPRVSLQRRGFTLFDEQGSALLDYEIDEYSAGLLFGREFSRHAGLFLGLQRFAGNASVRTGDPTIGNQRFNGGEWSLNAVYDRLDNRYVPSTGSFARLSYIASRPGLGADTDFEQLQASLFSAVTRERHTAWIGGRFNTTLDDNAPIYALYPGGGFLNMSGFEQAELIGQHFGFAMLGYRYRLAESGLMPAYAGMTVEYGNAAERRGRVFGDGVLNGSFYLGYDSPLGPLYLGLGWSEENSGLLFLRLGTLFGSESIGRR